MHSVEIAEVFSSCFSAADSVGSLLSVFDSGVDCGFSQINSDAFKPKRFRPYQEEFLFCPDRVVVLNWSRQIGKSLSLAFWALCRCVFRPNHTVCIFSNTVKNAEEILFKVEDFIRSEDLLVFSYILRKSRIEFANGSRIVVLAASARTARGYSGDVVLDEFAFYQSPPDVFGAVQPIISSNQDFRMVISSTPAFGSGSFFETLCNSRQYRVFSCSRSHAYSAYGVPVFSDKTGEPITPEQAEQEAIDKRAYRAAYELDFSAVGRRSVFSEEDVFLSRKAGGVSLSHSVDRPQTYVYIGVDVGRTGDRSVAWALSGDYQTQDVLILDPGELTDQVNLFLRWCAGAKKIAIDSTGVGAGFSDLLRRKFRREIMPVHFSSKFRQKGAKMAMPFALTFYLKKNWDKISIPDNPFIHNDLLIPLYGDKEQIITKRELGSHCDFYWALALANFAGMMTDRSILLGR